MAGMQFQIISREIIKPSSPTPLDLRTYKLSLLDQLTTHIYIPIVLFFSNEVAADHNPSSNFTERSLRIKGSLSKTLARYYPFAGRLKNDILIDCNDEGVDFVEAKTKSKLSEFLNKPESGALGLLFSDGFLWKDSCEDTSLLGIQVTFFACGGMAISLSISHKIADGCTISTFLSDWAAISYPSGKEVSPEFIATSILHLDVPFVVPGIELEKRDCITKRFVFDAPKIAKLKAMAADSGAPQNPTRVEVVTALLYKCAVAASSAKNSLLIQLVNMRARVVPPLSSTSVGNFSWYFTTTPKRESETKLQDYVRGLRDGIGQLCDKNVNNLKVNDWLLAVLASTEDVKVLFDDLDIYRYPLYKVDFGWGKPVWLRMADGVVKNTFVLFDDGKGDGIEAFVTLEEEDMAIFQSDEELLAFTSSGHISLP
ncbi:hypothetical protein RJ639_008576 [Escallonia herrerae]|uniref:BAHD acyltransferase n=1 Tax=Escallonia herrerae TaxID=1293975 RepID=A0AA89ASW3_9ASTE|nr:hypothetical protein RJ639_008576 [Escallonia herrerae]